MSASAKSVRDSFTFSLRGVASANSFGLVPAVADDLRVKDHGRRSGGIEADSPRFILALENTLARYFAPGCHQVTG